MSRDPTVVGHAKVGAEMFAGVISGFVDELSWKTIVGCEIPSAQTIEILITLLLSFRSSSSCAR